MWRWLQAVVQSAAPRTDHAFLLRSLRQSGLSEQAVAAWARRYTDGPAMQQALLELTDP